MAVIDYSRAICFGATSPRATARATLHWRSYWTLVPDAGGDVITPADVYLHGQATQLPKRQEWVKAIREKLDALAWDARMAETGDRGPGLAMAA